MKITTNKFVSAEYELYVDAETEGAEQELMERASADEPLTFIYGVGMMLPKFEEYLFGLKQGDTFDFTIENEDAYGPFDDDYIVELDRAIFEVDGQIDEEVLTVGNVVPFRDASGAHMNGQILSVDGEKIKVDFNHPLAGENLHFKGKVLEVRDATEQELAMISGGGGCGCGCDCDDSSDCGSGGCSGCN